MTFDPYFEEDGGPRYGSMTQNEWYAAVKAEMDRLRANQKEGPYEDLWENVQKRHAEWCRNGSLG